jgi:hypothetical protein
MTEGALNISNQNRFIDNLKTWLFAPLFGVGDLMRRGSTFIDKQAKIFK